MHMYPVGPRALVLCCFECARAVEVLNLPVFSGVAGMIAQKEGWWLLVTRAVARGSLWGMGLADRMSKQMQDSWMMNSLLELTMTYAYAKYLAREVQDYCTNDINTFLIASTCFQCYWDDMFLEADLIDHLKPVEAALTTSACHAGDDFRFRCLI